MTRVPQIIVTLSPKGQLRVELPGAFATRRVIDLTLSEAGKTLYRILRAQEADELQIGLDGAPTKAQVLHWERHSIWPAQGCRFCIAEGNAQPLRGRAAKKILLSRPDVTVRVAGNTKKIPEGVSGLPKPEPKPSGKAQITGTTTRSAESLGL